MFKLLLLVWIFKQNEIARNYLMRFKPWAEELSNVLVNFQLCSFFFAIFSKFTREIQQSWDSFKTHSDMDGLESLQIS